jgi:hypothetical protein
MSVSRDGSETLSNDHRPSGVTLCNTWRLIVIVAGIVPALLYVTGFMRWRHKRYCTLAKKYLRQEIL